MSALTQKFWDTSGLDRTHYRTYIETGSYRGFTIDTVLHEYDTIHSIELSLKWYAHCTMKFRQFDHVKVHRGDSREVLPALLETVREPSIVFLDAHYSGGTTARAQNDTPLLQELEILGQRTYPDIVVVDDTSFLGAKGGHEPEEPISDDDVWPAFAYDWSDTTKDGVLAKLKPGYALLTNANLAMTSSPRNDQFILYPT
jgi:hypothetical protein